MSKTLNKVLALVLALAMAFALVACQTTTPTTEPTDAATTEPATEPATEEKPSTLVVGYSPFSEKFSPFFAKTAYDQDAYVQTQVALINNDRAGNLILRASRARPLITTARTTSMMASRIPTSFRTTTAPWITTSRSVTTSSSPTARR